MDSTKAITLGQAFAHCASTSSYWLWIAIALVVSAGCAVGIILYEKKQEMNGYVKMILIFAIVAAIACSVFIRPTSVAQNTSIEMAERGHYLGY